MNNLNDEQTRLIQILETIQHQNLVKMVDSGNYKPDALAAFSEAVKVYTTALAAQKNGYYPGCDGWQARFASNCTKEKRDIARSYAREQLVQYFVQKNNESRPAPFVQKPRTNSEIHAYPADAYPAKAYPAQDYPTDRLQQQLFDYNRRGGSRRKKNTKRRKQKRSSASRKRRSSRRR